MKTIPQSTLDTVHTLLPELDSDAITSSIEVLLKQAGVREMAERLPDYFDTKIEGDRGVAVYFAQLVRRHNGLQPLIPSLPASFAPQTRCKKNAGRRHAYDCITPKLITDKNGNTFTLYLIPSYSGKQVLEFIARQPCTQTQIANAVRLTAPRASEIARMFEAVGWVRVTTHKSENTYRAIVDPKSLHVINRNGHGFENLLNTVIEILESQSHCTVQEIARTCNSKKHAIERLLEQLIGASLVTKTGIYYSLSEQEAFIHAQAS